ncbi:MAG: hypothetical protein VYE15_04780, partial [Myxococcota bacterium]|nr:hypothetical protein [Myxococcota bacterium]
MHTRRAPIHLSALTACAAMLLFGCTGNLEREGRPVPGGNGSSPHFGGFSTRGASNYFDAGGSESDTFQAS